MSAVDIISLCLLTFTVGVLVGLIKRDLTEDKDE